MTCGSTVLFPSIFIWNNQKTVRLLFLLLSSRNLPCFHKSRYLFFQQFFPGGSGNGHFIRIRCLFCIFRLTGTICLSLLICPVRLFLLRTFFLCFPLRFLFLFCRSFFFVRDTLSLGCKRFVHNRKNDAFPWSSKVIPKELTESAFEPRLSFI